MKHTEMCALTDTPRSLAQAWRTLEKVESVNEHADSEMREELDDQRRSLEATQEADTTAHMRMRSIASGFPLLSLIGGQWSLTDFRHGGTTSTGLLHTFELSFNQLKRPLGAEKRMIPMTPIWPGFAVNTIFYAAMLWLLWIARRTPGKIRRFVRVSRGRCPACGYIIAPGTAAASPGGGPCSECGAATPRSHLRIAERGR